jgi:hypothetical protein
MASTHKKVGKTPIKTKKPPRGYLQKKLAVGMKRISMPTQNRGKKYV